MLNYPVNSVEQYKVPEKKYIFSPKNSTEDIFLGVMS